MRPNKILQFTTIPILGKNKKHELGQVMTTPKIILGKRDGDRDKFGPWNNWFTTKWENPSTPCAKWEKLRMDGMRNDSSLYKAIMVIGLPIK